MTQLTSNLTKRLFLHNAIHSQEITLKNGGTVKVSAYESQVILYPPHVRVSLSKVLNLNMIALKDKIYTRN